MFSFRVDSILWWIIEIDALWIFQVQSRAVMGIWRTDGKEEGSDKFEKGIDMKGKSWEKEENLVFLFRNVEIRNERIRGGAASCHNSMLL